MDETMIPCEYCDVLINLYNYEWHTKQCATADRHRVEEKPKEISETPITTLSFCKYCQQVYSVEYLQEHQSHCLQNSNFHPRPSTHNSIRSRTNDRRSGDQCPRCRQERSSSEILRLQCNCSICAHCFRNILYEQKEFNKVLSCSRCKRSVRDVDIEQLKNLPEKEINSLKSYQKEKLLLRKSGMGYRTTTVVANCQPAKVSSDFPPYWDLSSPNNFFRHKVEPYTDEYKFVADKFRKTMKSNQIVAIERIQNRRWYRQFIAHRDEFIERHGESTEQWLFHGCSDRAAAGIVKDCFNRSYAINCAYGQGIYFVREAAVSRPYALRNANNVKRMFMARVLVGTTTMGNQSTHVCPSGFDTTGDGYNIFVTYHDSQAYGEYLIEFH